MRTTVSGQSREVEVRPVAGGRRGRGKVERGGGVEKRTGVGVVVEPEGAPRTGLVAGVVVQVLRILKFRMLVGKIHLILAQRTVVVVVVPPLVIIGVDEEVRVETLPFRILITLSKGLVEMEVGVVVI